VPAAEAADDPVSSPQAAQLLNPLRSFRHVALAVSGGGDSMALMWLAARWAGETDDPPQLTVLTVDHGLRPNSAEEARWVLERAQHLGLAGVVLEWRGDKPVTGVQARARQARYDLLMRWCGDHAAGALSPLTAWTTRSKPLSCAWPAAAGSTDWPGSGKSAPGRCATARWRF
jgi:tRNA(Ile)-lysidine synthase